MRTHFVTLLALTSVASAHFVLHWPPTAGFDDDEEPSPPCGGATPFVNSSSPNINVDQFAVQILSTHPAGTWSFLGTTNTQAPYNFTEIVPAVNTTGEGNFCLTNLRAPSDWAGKSGIIQVIDNSVDGLLYQCAPVNFVSGTNSSVGETCKNMTGFVATWTGSSSVNGSAVSSSAAPTSSATSTSSGAAAVATMAGSVLGGLGLLAAGLML